MIDLTILMLILISSLPCFTSQKPYCNQTCPGSILNNNIPYPFGFSSGCEIRLNCTANSTVVIGEFSVQKLTQDDLLVSLPAKCGREVQTLGQLYGDNYAPTSDNAFLMENCTEQVLTCSVPESTIQPNLQVIYCGDQGDVYSNVSCYSGDRNSMFLGYDNIVTKTGCRFLLSGVVVKIVGDNPAVSLNVQVVKLGWWLKGPCQCSHDAICTEFVSPVDGGGAYRCRCKDGYDGDGYIASSGCRKAKPVVSSHCNTLKFMFGHCKGSERAGVVVGIIAIGATLISSIGLMYCYTRHHKSLGKSNRRLCEAKGITIPIYSYKEIQNATNGFSDKQKLGTGGYGTVYKGKIGKGEWVAIKRIKHRYGDDVDQVMNEIILLSSVNHPNLVRLLGCSFDRNDQILIYEFMPNGTLSEHLQRERGSGLPWPVRLTIAIEIAQGIAYLHSTMNPPIYHRDVKSCNILLDYNFKTKVADFGLSRLGLGITESSHISTAPRGTPGYLDPQYHQNFHLTDKSDVYSFGVVLVELITALKAVDFSRKHSEVNLASLAVDRIGKGNLDEIIDPFLKPVEDHVSIRKVAEVAFRCLAYDSDMRPPMTEVASELEHIKVSNFAS